MFRSLTAIFIKPEDEVAGDTNREGQTPHPNCQATPVPPNPQAMPSHVPAFQGLPTGNPLPSAGQAGLAEESKFAERLGRAIEDGNASGIDFYEFMKSLEALTPLIPDEVTRYRAAIGTLAAQGAKPEYILQTAQHYLDLLDEKTRSFQTHIAARTDETVTRKIAQADSVKEQIRAKSEQINALTKEIGALTQNEMAARNEATLAKAEIEATCQTFENVKARYVTMITSTRDKLAKYGLNKAQE